MKNNAKNLVLASLLMLSFSGMAKAGDMAMMPSMEAVNSCSAMKEHESCSFMKDSAKMMGTCEKAQDGKLACMEKAAAPAEGMATMPK